MASDSDEYCDYELDFHYQEPKYIELEAKFRRSVNIQLLKQAQSAVAPELLTSLRSIEKKTEENRIRVRDKADRATVETVLDNRTRLVLYKMINTGHIAEVFGCISTGKEANVYYATASSNEEFALKVYKTSILVFKDRSRYVEGEFRFRRGFNKGNPRKMVGLWAEKEMRNLKRLQAAGVPSPVPVLVKQNVLLMSFLGLGGEPYRKLKDVELHDRSHEFYKKTVFLLRKLYQECRLVHADFSEYNLLFHDEEIYVIDVSQSVEHDHPQALNFLKRDCFNCNNFFRRQGTDVLSLQSLFNFITELSSAGDEVLWAKANSDQDIQDDLFRELYIPRTLQEIDLGNETYLSQQGLFEGLTGVVTAQGESDSEEEDSGSAEEGAQGKKPTGDVLYGGLTKNERKQKVKAQNKEKRANKMPKHVKKQQIKQTAHKHRNAK